MSEIEIEPSCSVAEQQPSSSYNSSKETVIELHNNETNHSNSNSNCNDAFPNVMSNLRPDIKEKFDKYHNQATNNNADTNNKNNMLMMSSAETINDACPDLSLYKTNLSQHNKDLKQLYNNKNNQTCSINGTANRCDVGVQVDGFNEFMNRETGNNIASANHESNNKRPHKYLSSLKNPINLFRTLNQRLFTNEQQQNVNHSHSNNHNNYKNHNQINNHIGTDDVNNCSIGRTDAQVVNGKEELTCGEQQQHSLSWMAQITQRYFRRKSCASQNNSTRQSINSLNNQINSWSSSSQSAPTTPVRWIETLSNAHHQQKASANILHAASDWNGSVSVATTNDEAQNMKSNNGSGTRPSVRFADTTNNCGPNTINSAALSNRIMDSITDDDDLIEEEEEEEEEIEDDEEEDCHINDLSANEQDQENGNGLEDATNLVRRLFGTTNEGSPNHFDKSLLSSQGECPMDSKHFRHYGYRLIDYICNYLDTIKDRRVTPLNIEPGYLKSLIDPAAPEQGEPFAKIMEDFEKHIMCGITHWQHPHFHAYFPAGNAYPSILADMLSDALGCVGFSWAASPAYTELEIIMLDWMGKMIGLPDEFLCLSGNQESRGGGVIQGSASECVLVNMLAARHWAIERLRSKYPDLPDGMLLSKLIGYCSKEAHSCVEKAAMIGLIRMRALETDADHSLRGSSLAAAIEQDLDQGLEPFLVCATLGTTSCVSFDNLSELGPICERYNIWLHVDAAYAGSALICPEFQYLMQGIEKASSFNMNPNKWMLINFDCSLMWVKDRFKLTRAFVVDPLYLQHSYSDQAIDYRHWGIPLSRRFRALKLWFVIRNYGISGLQKYIRNHVRLAKLFESFINSDCRFVVTNKVLLGLVCFRLIGSNALNQRLLSMINASGKLHMVPASVNGRYVIRFCVCDQNAQEQDVRYAFECIAEFATELLSSIKSGRERIRAISAQNTVEMLASAMPPSLELSESANQQQNEDSKNMKDDPRKQVLRNSPIISERSVSMDLSSTETNQTQMVIRSATDPRADDSSLSPLSRTGYPGCQDEESVSSSLSYRPTSRLGLSKSPLQKQRSMLASGDNDDDGSPISDHFNDIEEPLAPLRSGIQCQPANCHLDQERESSKSTPSSQRRVRATSGRYKRKFFVRVVSDPRVYRASISGDINAHSSSASLAGASNGSQASIHANAGVQNQPCQQPDTSTNNEASQHLNG